MHTNRPIILQSVIFTSYFENIPKGDFEISFAISLFFFLRLFCKAILNQLHN